MKLFKKSIITCIIFPAFFVNATEFNPGPYGQNYFDVAGQFKLPDLNGKLGGDVNQDDILNIQDIILVDPNSDKTPKRITRLNFLQNCSKEESLKTKFDLSDKVVVIADGLDKKAQTFIESIFLAGGTPVILGDDQVHLHKAHCHLIHSEKQSF